VLSLELWPLLLAQAGEIHRHCFFHLIQIADSLISRAAVCATSAFPTFDTELTWMPLEK
jgi:hypothetical protein